MNTHYDAAIGLIDKAPPQPKPLRFSRRWVLALAFNDVAMLIIAAFVGVIFVAHVRPLVVAAPSIVSAGIIVALQLLMFERLHLYRRTYASAIRDEFYYTSAALTIGALPLFVLFSFVPAYSTSRFVIVAALAVAIPLVGGSRAVLHELQYISQQQKPRRITLVGHIDRLEAVTRSLNLLEGAHVLRIGVDDLDASVEAMRTGAAFDPQRIEWFARALAWQCDVLMLTEALPPWSLPLILQVAAKKQIKVAFAPPRFRVHAYGMALEVDGEQTLLVPLQLRACTRQAQALKRICDVATALVLLVVLAPVFAATALALVLESGTPILYRQRRVGLGGKLFDILKFRSMRLDAERGLGPVWASQGDPRVTRVGRFIRRCSLDELPQLVNVLRGDMSIVGPRPERPEFVESFRASVERYDERHLVRPGITGWSQINLQRTLRPADAGRKLSYDLFYVEQWSLFLDAYIVVKTAVEFLFHKAA